MAADDLFTWLDAIWNKSQPVGTFPAFIAHRFLASDKDLAPVAYMMNKSIRDPAIAFATWQALMPEGIGAPRLTYPTAKKRPEAEKLTQRMMTVLHVRRAVAEDMQAIVALARRMDGLYAEFGIEAPGTEIRDDAPERNKKPKGPVGLMAMLK